MQIQIDVISDFICPWCYIGEKRLARAIESLPDRNQRGSSVAAV